MVLRGPPEADFVARLWPLADRELSEGIQEDVREVAAAVLGEVPGPFLEDFRIHTEDGALVVVAHERIVGSYG